MTHARWPLSWLFLFVHLAGCTTYRLVPPTNGEEPDPGYPDLSQVVQEGNRIQIKARYKATVKCKVQWVRTDSLIF